MRSNLLPCRRGAPPTPLSPRRAVRTTSRYGVTDQLREDPLVLVPGEITCSTSPARRSNCLPCRRRATLLPLLPARRRRAIPTASGSGASPGPNGSPDRLSLPTPVIADLTTPASLVPRVLRPALHPQAQWTSARTSSGRLLT
jgi:hypothetical protein